LLSLQTRVLLSCQVPFVVSQLPNSFNK